MSSSSFAVSKESRIQPSNSEKIGEKIHEIERYILTYDQPSYLKTNIPIFLLEGISEFHLTTLLFVAVTTNKVSPEKSKSKRASVINNGKIITKQKLNSDMLNTIIKGKTLEIYYYMNHVNSEVGIREITRIFEYSSPALAAYHLNRLVEYDLALKTENNKYILSNTDLKIGKYSNYIQISNLWISQSLIFISILTLFSLFAITYFILNVHQRVWGVTFIPLSLISLFLIIKMHKNNI